MSAGAGGLLGAHRAKVSLTSSWCLVALVSACFGPRLAESTGPLASPTVTPDNSPPPLLQLTPPRAGD